MKHKLNTLFRVIMVACFASASISSFASCEEAINANTQELKPDSSNVVRRSNITVCDSINMPVFIVDGVEVQMQDLDSLPTDDIVSMKVVQDEAVRKIFSPRLGAVIFLTTKSKRFLTPVLENYNRMKKEKEQNRIPGQLLIRGDSINMPVFIVDGVEVQLQDLDSIPKDDIERVEVIKDEKIKRIFSPRLGGVVLFTTKSKRFLTPVLENYNRMKKEKEQNRIPGQLLIRGDSINAASFKLVNPHLKASFPGGESALYEFIESNLQYPEEAKKNNEHGRIIVTFWVEKNGTITNARILRGRTPSLDAEALRIVSIMPKWEPGKINGEPKRVSCCIPITFK